MAVYLEEFLDTVTNLPDELKHHLQELRSRDDQYHEQRKQIIQLQKHFLHDSIEQKDGNKKLSLAPPPPPPLIDKKYQMARALADEKLMIAEKTVDLLNKHCKKLEDNISEALRDLEETGAIIPGSFAEGGDSPDHSSRSRNKKTSRAPYDQSSLLDNGDDVDMFDEDGGEPVYCVCRQVSFGEMIACDNSGKCPYEWFHYECVGLSEPPLGTWYCPVCAPKMKRKAQKA